MSTACAYRDGNMNGPMYDSTGKVCSTMNGKTKILLIAGCSAAAAALVGLGVYWLIRRSRMASRARRDQSEIVPARPLSAWVGGARPGSMMAATSGGYDPEFHLHQQRERRGTDASSSTGYTGKGGDGSPVPGYAPVGLALRGGDDEMYANPYGGAPPQQQGQQRRSFYDSPAQAATRGLPIPPAATSTRRYSQQQQPQYQEGAQDVYYYNDDQAGTRSRSPSPVGGYSAGGAYGAAPASPSAYYPQAGVHEAYERVELGDEYRERVEMLVPEHRFIQPGR